MSANLITILGSGIVGCTCAMVAKSLGLDVKLVGAQTLCDRKQNRDPRFASAYPAASIIPHTVNATDIKELMAVSGDIFSLMANHRSTGVRSQLHLELCECKSSIPGYANYLRNWRPISDIVGVTIPKRQAARELGGFGFDTWFADIPIYYNWLEQQLQSLGVTFSRKVISRDDLNNIDGDVLINCLGSGAFDIFPSLGRGIYIRGILLEWSTNNLWIERRSGQPVSYNYKLSASEYANPDGTPADVYFYPRQASIIFGGTREPGQLSSESCWQGKRSKCRYTRLDGIDVPQPIIEVNRELVEQMTGRVPSGNPRVLVGYRHAHSDRFANQIARIAVREDTSRQVVDCLGFGGAGVTLSWGAALKAAHLSIQCIRGTIDSSSHVQLMPDLRRMIASMCAC